VTDGLVDVESATGAAQPSDAAVAISSAKVSAGHAGKRD
jgi:hypothetical protein